MSEIKRVVLFGKLNPLAYKAIEGATVFCKLRSNPYVEIEHWLQQILQTPDSDLHRIVRHFELDGSRLAGDLTAALDRLPRGASSISDLSTLVESAVERAWVFGTLMFGESQVRTGHLVVGMLKTPSLRNALLAISRQFERVKAGSADRRIRQDCRGLAGGRAARHRWRAASRRLTGRGKCCNGAGGDGQAGSAAALLHRPHGKSPQRGARSDPGPRYRDPPDRRHPHAPSAEQSDPHRRGRRRQDGGGRRVSRNVSQPAMCHRP